MIPDVREGFDEATKSRHLEPPKIGQFILILVLVSLACAVVFHPTRQIAILRGPLASIGINAGLMGAGCAAWFSIRMKSRLCDLALLLSIPALSYWGWCLYQATYD